MSRPIGKLEYVDPRSLWENEAKDFTPWLGEHLSELSKALGLELELVTSEEQVGSFYCDIYAREKRSGRKVIIENQLASTDHSHLGQLLTYAAGLEADIICWISPDFRDEHTLALDWLNNHTSEDVQFLGVRLRAVQIDGSNAAPLFELASAPNTFQRNAKRQTEETELGKFYLDFWKEVLERARTEKLYSGTRKSSSDNWINFGSGVSAYSYSIVFAQGNIFRVELYIDHGPGKQELNEASFEALESEKESIEKDMQIELSWQRLEHARACRIAADKLYIDRQAEKEELITWGIEMFSRMKDVFGPRIRKLPGKTK